MRAAISREPRAHEAVGGEHARSTPATVGRRDAAREAGSAATAGAGRTGRTLHLVWPTEAGTLNEALARHAAEEPHRPIIQLLTGRRGVPGDTITYGSLHEGALAAGHADERSTPVGGARRRRLMTRATLSPERRTEDLRRVAEESFDVLVVGGGVTGAGIALDATTRGLRAAIVETQDGGAGTSSRSSKLIHGGLRYLQMLDFHLVRQALHERSLLLRTVAPHLVRPVPIVYPLRRPVVERAYVGAGIALYDALAWSTGTSRGLPWHRDLSRAQALAAAPGLRRDSLVGAIEYFDSQVDDARFVTELVRTAVGFGSIAVNRVAMVGALQDGTRVTGARVTDRQDRRVGRARRAHGAERGSSSSPGGTIG